jgi:hypothetical protein
MREYTHALGLLVLLLSIGIISKAQPKTDTTFKPSGKLWGYSFGDYYYKAHSDSLNRGESNQYSGIEKSRNAFQIRRIYLGYNYDITQKFSAELLLAAEDNITTNTGVTTGDLLSNNKLSIYIKLANLRWKNIWKGTDMVIGEVFTPAFPLLTEPTWGYRSIEKTIADRLRTPSYDLGVTLQGKFDPDKGNYGYNIMVGNGTGARPEGDKYKWFYGDVYAKFFNQRLIVDLYADYQRMNWSSSFHHSRNMIKGFVAYTTPSFTAGVEALINYGKNDVVRMCGGTSDTLDAVAMGVSTYVRGIIVKDKLGYFLRFDEFNPNTKYDNSNDATYKGFTVQYEPNDKGQFITGGVDFTPAKNVHFMPNIWYNSYTGQQANLKGRAQKDYDLVYRITFYYVFGK